MTVSRLEVVNQISDILDNTCVGCTKKFESSQNHDTALRYCLDKCAVGTKLRELGKKLEK